MASLPFRKSGRYFKYGISSAVVFTALVALPPKERLPSPLLPSRVLLEGVGRVGRCGMVGAQIFFDYSWNVRGPAADDQSAWNVVHERSARRLVALAELNGGLYVKAGQIFANLSHVLPQQYCTIMSVLQNEVVKRPYSEVVAVLEREMEGPLSDIFSELDPNPIAAASLAQVHRGRLRKEDIDVAVKVQYIDVAQRFWGDMRTINLMLGIAGYFYPGYDLSQIVVKLNDTVAAELDFRLEGRNSDRAGADLRKGGFGDRVVTPRVFWNYTTKRVLTTQFIHNAVKISDREGIKQRKINPAKVATWFFDALSYQLFTTGFFHGDPHAGNVLVHKLPNGKPQVVLLDFGLCAELSPEQTTELSAIWTASVTHDSAALATLAQRYGCDDLALFASCFLNHPYEYFSPQVRVISIDAHEAMRNQLKHKMNKVNDIVAALPKEYALVLRNIMAGKAINRELHDPVNRPLLMLKYSMVKSNQKDSKWHLHWLLFKAWIQETISTIVLAYIRWAQPEVAEIMESALNVSG